MSPKILLANKFYYNRGGDCMVTMNTEQLLRAHGHEVAVFSMQYPENVASDYSEYFATEVKFNGGAGAKIAAMKRTLGWGDVKRSFGRLLDDFKPDVVHLGNIHSYLSPVLATMAHKRGIRVVWTLHDYKLLCPSYSCLREGKPCELCYGHKFQVVKNRCMKGSLAGSALAWVEALKWNRKVLERNCDAWICPSQFMASKMQQGGFDASKMHVLTNFVDLTKLAVLQQQAGGKRGDYGCYVGRLSAEKGVATLLEAAAGTDTHLMVAGSGPQEQMLRERHAGDGNIEFLGRIDAQQVAQLLSGARWSVMPSECYDNNPLGVIESLCSGTPVVGTDIGGIPELIGAHDGLIAQPGDVQTLRAAMVQAGEREWNHADIARRALEKFSGETHYQKLLKIYQNQS